MYCLTNSTSSSLSSTISRILISVNNSNSTFVFLKHACQANPGADKKNGQDQVHIFQYTYF